MRYKLITINNFRQFNNQKIILGKYITVLSGRNSTGKSTILGMLGNSGELKKKEGTTYSGKPFKAEFSELFKGSKEFDKRGTDRFRIDLCDDNENIVDYRSFRTAWQKKDYKAGVDGAKNNKSIDRFRVIPFRKYVEEGRQTEAKFRMPVMYLGLSRLYPIGEANDTNIASNAIQFKSIEEKKWFFDNYSSILSLHDNLKEVTNYAIGETDKKSGIGVNTDKYDYRTNSAGQDNLGQILASILSFKQLKNQQGSEWNGGLLLIDELDATLHPAAQKRLFQLLFSEAKHIGIQVVFTTHSLSLLREITIKTANNSDDDVSNNIEVYYFTNANRSLQISRNPLYTFINDDLAVKSYIQNGGQIKLYSEDEEARWLLKNLLNDYLSFVDMVNTKISCTELMDLYMADQKYFGNVLMVLDGDVTDNILDNKIPVKTRDYLGNIIRLPGGVRPEQVIYDYILSLPAEHEYWSEGSRYGFTWDYFHDNGPDSQDYSKGKERERYKNWFKDHQSGFETTHLMTYWINDNKELVDQFRTEFLTAYNKIAKRTMSYMIPMDDGDE